MRWFPRCFFLRISTTQCATSGFASFLKCWNPLIEGYNSVTFDFYHDAVLMCVLENFNCMLLGGWTLSGIRTAIPRSLTFSVLPVAVLFPSHLNNSMRHGRICFIFQALKSSYWGLQFACFQFLSYCPYRVCARGLQLHAAWWLDPDAWHWTLVTVFGLAVLCT